MTREEYKKLNPIIGETYKGATEITIKGAKNLEQSDVNQLRLFMQEDGIREGVWCKIHNDVRKDDVFYIVDDWNNLDIEEIVNYFKPSDK